MFPFILRLVSCIIFLRKQPAYYLEGLFMNIFCKFVLILIAALTLPGLCAAWGPYYSYRASRYYCPGACYRGSTLPQVDNACVNICIDKEHTLDQCTRACSYY